MAVNPETENTLGKFWFELATACKRVQAMPNMSIKIAREGKEALVTWVDVGEGESGMILIKIVDANTGTVVPLVSP